MRKQELSPAWQRLVEAMQSLNFGRLENLAFKAGEPCLTSSLRILRECKSKGENDSRPECSLADFELRQEVTEFYRDMIRRGDVVVESLEIKHGIPLRWSVEVTLAV